MNTASSTVALPLGLQRGGVWQRTARLLEWTGEVEMRAAAAPNANARERARAILLGTLAEVGNESANAGVVDSLTLGDRDALLLHIRRRALGERMSAVVRCPSEACNQPLDVELRVSDLLVDPHPSPKSECLVEVSLAEDTTKALVLQVRAPTVGDMEALADLPQLEPVSALLERCVLGVRDEAGLARALPQVWPPHWVERISSVLEEQDPQADVRLELCCPHCGHSFESALDVADYVSRELHQRAQHVLREVHTLALYYHWGEREILALPAQRRAFYLSLLAEMTATAEEGAPP